MSEARQSKQVYSRSEVARHSTRDDCWIIIGGKVYDVTNWLDSHPGGPDVLTQNAGQDATKAFADVGHSESARELKEKYYIGDLSGVSCGGQCSPKCIGVAAAVAVAVVAAVAVGVWWWRTRK